MSPPNRAAVSARLMIRRPAPAAALCRACWAGAPARSSVAKAEMTSMAAARSAARVRRRDNRDTTARNGPRGAMLTTDGWRPPQRCGARSAGTRTREDPGPAIPHNMQPPAASKEATRNALTSHSQPRCKSISCRPWLSAFRRQSHGWFTPNTAVGCSDQRVKAKHSSEAAPIPADVNDSVETGCHLSVQCVTPETGGQCKRLEAGGHVGGGVRVNRPATALVPSVEGGKQIYHFGAPNLAHHEAIRSHSQGLAHEVPKVDRSAPLDVGRPRLQSNHVRVRRLEFRGVLHEHYSFRRVRPGQECRQESRLPAPGATRNEEGRAR